MLSCNMLNPAYVDDYAAPIISSAADLPDKAAAAVRISVAVFYEFGIELNMKMGKQHYRCFRLAKATRPFVSKLQA